MSLMDQSSTEGPNPGRCKEAGFARRRAQTLCRLPGGRGEKIRAADVLGASTKDMAFASAQIGKINVDEVSTNVAVACDIASHVLRKLTAGKVKGRTLKVRMLEDG
jgi:ATP-independent RNA helicase DbpA